MKIKKSTVLPIVLLVYLGVMSYIGYGDYSKGNSSSFYFFGIITASLVVIILLHFVLKKKERLRREREDDMDNHNK